MAVFISGEYGIVDVAEEDAFAGVVPVTAIPEQYRYRAIVAEDGGTPADPLPSQGLSLDQFLWTARPLIVFSDTPHDPNFQRQMQLLAADPAALLDRQVVVIADTDPGPSDGAPGRPATEG